VFEKAYIVARCLYAEDFAEPVVHFYGRGAHSMFDASALDAHMVIVTRFALIARV
jgi:hypothetical protein